MNYQNIPEKLKKTGRFCFWKREERDGRVTKIPYCLNGRKARANDIRDFVDYETAAANAYRFDGIGLGIFEGWCAVDIDHCYENGELSEAAREIIDTMQSYTEFSPSGAGVRIIFRAESLAYDAKRYFINNRALGLEIYVSGATSRYVTLTGNAILNVPVRDCSKEIAEILGRYMSRQKCAASAPAPVRPAVKTQSYERVVLTDSENRLLARIRASAQKEKFNALWAGCIPDGKSHSEADFILCLILSFWCRGDAEMVNRMFRASGLYRKKWERADYRNITINNAIATQKHSAQKTA